MFQDIEPFSGWIGFYSHETDARSPFYGVEHNLFKYDRFIYTFVAHPLWDTIESESLLVKILFAEYETGWAVIELLGEWNDLHDNDFRLLKQNVLDVFLANGVNKLIFVCENVFNAYLDSDDYYQEAHDALGDGWMMLLKAREGVRQEFVRYGISPYFYWSAQFDALNWRKLKPWQLFDMAEQSLGKFLK